MGAVKEPNRRRHSQFKVLHQLCELERFLPLSANWRCRTATHSAALTRLACLQLGDMEKFANLSSSVIRETHFSHIIMESASPGSADRENNAAEMRDVSIPRSDGFGDFLCIL